jgi:hypothetical protein
LLNLHFVRRGQDFDGLEAVAQAGREVLFEVLAQHAVDRFVVQRQRRRTQLGGEVRLVLEGEASMG